MRPVPILLLALPLVAACGDSHGKRRGEAVPPFESTLGLWLVPASATPAALPPGLPADADFLTDAARTRVFDPALAASGRLDALLDALARTGSIALTGAGPYLALQQLGPTSPGMSRAAALHPRGRSFHTDLAGAELELWSLERRERSSGAHELDLWVPRGEAGFGALVVFLDAELLHPVDAEHPFGRTELAFAGAVDAAALGAPLFAGSLQSDGAAGQPATLALYERTGDLGAVPAPGEHAEEVQLAVELDAGGASGRARVFRRERFDDKGMDSGIRAEEWLFEFDGTHVLRGRDGGFDRAFTRADPDEHVWRYGLYDPVGGERVKATELVGGFGVRLVDGSFGWYGPFGLAHAPGAPVTDGDEVTHEEFGVVMEGMPYTVRSAPGRLVRLTRRPLALSALDGERMEWFDGARTLRVAWDEAVGEWHALEELDVNGAFVPLVPPEAVDTVAAGALALWSEALGGPVAWVHGDAQLAWFELELVDGDDPAFGAGSELELFGFVDCLASGITAAEAEAGTIHLPDAPDAFSGHRFVFDRADLTLYHDGGGVLARVGLGDGEVPTSGPHAWGMTSGPLLPVNAVTAGTVPGAWSEDVFYVWETGANDWNRALYLIDQLGAFVRVPLSPRFEYVHTLANDRSGSPEHAGRTLVLSFDRAAGLVGFPRTGLDLDGDGVLDRSVPELALADGVLVGPSGAELLVRGLDVEQLLSEEPAYAGPLSLNGAGDLVVPGSSSIVMPANGPPPPATDPPRVIVGEIVGPVP